MKMIDNDEICINKFYPLIKSGSDIKGNKIKKKSPIKFNDNEIERDQKVSIFMTKIPNVEFYDENNKDVYLFKELEFKIKPEDGDIFFTFTFIQDYLIIEINNEKNAELFKKFYEITINKNIHDFN
jgi:hypothetical protein